MPVAAVLRGRFPALFPVLLAVLLGACATSPAAPSHTPLRKDFALDVSRVHWVRLRNWQEADAVCRRMEISATGHDYVVPPGGHIGGCAVFDRGQASCTIYAPLPGWQEDMAAMAILGHEFLHCMNGNFHRVNGDVH